MREQGVHGILAAMHHVQHPGRDTRFLRQFENAGG